MLTKFANLLKAFKYCISSKNKIIQAYCSYIGHSRVFNSFEITILRAEQEFILQWVGGALERLWLNGFEWFGKRSHNGHSKICLKPNNWRKSKTNCGEWENFNLIQFNSIPVSFHHFLDIWWIVERHLPGTAGIGCEWKISSDFADQREEIS